MEDKCKQCDDFKKKNLQWMSWEVYCKLMNTEQEFATQVKAAISRPDDGEVDFTPHDVEHKHGVGWRVLRRGLFLSRAEVKTETNFFPEDLGLPVISITDETGKRIRGIVIEDPKRRYREIEWFSETVDMDSEAVLQSDNMVFAQQSTLTFDHFRSTRREKGGKHPVKSHSKLLTLAELKDLGPVAKEIGLPADGDGDSDDSVVVRRIDGAGNELIPVATVKAKSGASSIGAGGRSVGKSPDAKIRKGAPSIGEDLESNQDDDKVGSAKTPSHWMSKIDINRILVGQKLGREEGFAAACIDRHREQGSDEASALAKHLKRASFAKQLTVKGIASMDTKDLHIALDGLRADGNDLPTFTKEALLKRSSDLLWPACLTGDAQAVRSFCDLYVPWAAGPARL